MIRAGLAALSLLVAAGCSKDSSPKPEPEAVAPPAPAAARPATTGDIAVVNVEGQLLAVSMNGSTKPYVVAGANWCATDNRARVIWYTTGDELRYVDLEDGASHVAISGIDELAMVIIDYGEGVQIGGYDEVTPDVALHVKMSSEPAIAARVLCDGDAWVYCYDDNGDDDIDNDPLNAELEAKRVKYNALKPADSARFSALYTRGVNRKLWLEGPEGETPPNVKVDPTDCDENPEDCGLVQVLPSTPPIWNVVVGNSRGDYYHESYQLYDPTTREFLLTKDPSKRSPKPAKSEDGNDVEGLLLAPSGKAYIMRDVVATWDKVVWHVQDASACGWIGPMYRIGGPRG